MKKRIRPRMTVTVSPAAWQILEEKVAQGANRSHINDEALEKLFGIRDTNPETEWNEEPLDQPKAS